MCNHVPHSLSRSELLHFIEKHPWNSLKYRRVQHYGYAFDYTRNNVDKTAKIGPLPGIFSVIAARVSAEFAPNIEFDQLTVNEYLPGQGIKPHVDTHSAFEGPIVRRSQSHAHIHTRLVHAHSYKHAHAHACHVHKHNHAPPFTRPSLINP